MKEVLDKIESHDKRLTAVEFNVNDLVPALKENTQALSELANQIGIYMAKHEKADQEIQQLRKHVTQYGQDIAAMKPTVDSVRGLAWKIVGGCVLGGGGISAMVIALTKMAG